MANGQNISQLDVVVLIRISKLIYAPNEMFYHKKDSHIICIKSLPILVQNQPET